MITPKISVLMPVYNTKEEYLRGAIESILNQTYQDFEFIILNDCSTNNVKEVILSYNDRRIKYLENEQNLGISKTRNILIDVSKGEYLAVMDHDDISLPKRFEKQINYMEKNKEIGVVSSWYMRFPKKQIKKNPTNNRDIKIALMRKCALLHPASMIRKSVLIENNLRYEEEFSPSEDYALWCNLIKYTSFHNIPEVLFLYRWHFKNTSFINSQGIDKATLAIHKIVKLQYPALYKTFVIRKKIFSPFEYLRIRKFL